jgi:hypothetical protein
LCYISHLPRFTPRRLVSGWPFFRYGKAELKVKMQSDGEPPTAQLADWAVRYRLIQPRTHAPLVNDTYAEQAPANETVP